LVPGSLSKGCVARRSPFLFYIALFYGELT
jgi:hypothetical protein